MSNNTEDKLSHPSIHEWSGLPGIELVQLVEQGIKPMAETYEDIPSTLNRIEIPRVYSDGEYSADYTVYIYYRDNEVDAQRAAELKSLGRPFTEDEAREFGRLMGYGEEKTNAWVEWQYRGQDGE